ncbi:MAG TPA: toll/interleukin-1 receptor domain-containing protein [Burkholderiales bacterium]|nr:toll/interleukin-1 receptor domain-containing protein [Burkholderiales bacterium]
MATVFISYRREETAGEARALFQALVARLGEASVFMDVDAIALGRDFRQVLQERLASCDLLLALVGRGWIEAKNASGKRRLEDPTDYVRLEIEAALKRNIPVTPVLLQGAQMPAEQQLPESMRDFVYRNGFELSHNRWESDVQEMLKRLGLGSQREPGSVRETDPGKAPGARPPAGKPWLAIAGASVMVIAIVAGGLLYYGKSAEDAAKAAADAQAAAQAEREREAAEKKRAESAAARAERERIAAERKRAEAAAQAERERIRLAEQAAAAKAKAALEPAAVAAGVKIEKAECANLGNGRFRLHLWGWASGEVGTRVLAAPRVGLGTNSIEEGKMTCLAWATVKVDDGPIQPCTRTEGRPHKTPWSSQVTFQWRTGSPTIGFAATTPAQPARGANPVSASDTVTFSCAVAPPVRR